MRRLGALLMIVGANIAVGSIAVAFWRSALQCAVDARTGGCQEGGVIAFFEMMTSSVGLFYWVVFVFGLFVFWRGKRMRPR